MNTLRLAVLASCLSSCSLTSLSPLITNNALDYHQVVEDVTNNILVTNVLRAKDHAPLHYSDLASIQVTTASAASVQVTFPILVPPASTTPGIAQVGGISLNNSPLVNLATLDTDDFIRGITTPISSDTIKHFLDQGLDPRIAMLIFFDGIKGYQDDFRVKLPIEYVQVRSPDQKPCGGDNNPQHYCVNINAGEMVSNSPDNENEFWKYLTIVNYEYYGLYANEYHELSKLGKFVPNPKTPLKDVSAPDPTKIRLGSEGDIFAISPDPKLTLCRYIGSGDEQLQNHEDVFFGHSNSRIPMTTNDHFRMLALSRIAEPIGKISSVCTSHEVPVRPDVFKPIPILYTRSPQGMIEFLGALLRLQDKNKRNITIGVEPASGALFTLSNQAENVRFLVEYRGQSYYVKNASEKDHSLEVLALVNQIFDLYKSAKAVPRFPAITVAP